MIDRVRNAACALLLAALLPTVAYAQGTPPARGNASLGVSIQYMSLQDEFRQNAGEMSWYDRGALGFDLLLPLTRSGLLSLRADYMFGRYDKGCYGCRHSFGSISFGPEVLVPYGPVRPYAMGAWGHLNFDSFDDAGGTKVDTGVSQWIYGGGVRIPLKRSSGWSLDVGLRSHRGGNVSYVGKAGVHTNPDGSVSVDSAHSRTPFVMYSIGFQHQFH